MKNRGKRKQQWKSKLSNLPKNKEG
jgi:hypothetical protein